MEVTGDLLAGIYRAVLDRLEVLEYAVAINVGLLVRWVVTVQGVAQDPSATNRTLLVNDPATVLSLFQAIIDLLS